MAGKGEMHMLSAALFLLANSLFLTLRLTGDTGSFPKPLSAGEERMYLERSLAGDLEARNILVEHNLRLVAHIIKKYYTQAAEQEDLISIGTIGLIKAVDTFRPERKIRLATYASRCVENEVLMYFRSRKSCRGRCPCPIPSSPTPPGAPSASWTWWAATTPCSRIWPTGRSACASGNWWAAALRTGRRR